MTQPPTSDTQSAYDGPRLSGGRIFGLALCAALCLIGGRLFQAGFVSFIGPAVCAPSQACHGGLTTLAFWMGGAAVWAIGTGAAVATVITDEKAPDRLPIPATLCATFVLALVGAVLGERQANLPTLIPLGLLAPLTAFAAVRGERRLREHQKAYLAGLAVARRLAEHGLSTFGTVTEVEAVSETHEGALDLRITLRFTAGDGVEHHFTHTGDHPVHAAPRIGDRMAVRYDPRSPGTAQAGALLPPDPARRAGPPQDARPSLTDELDRLAALRREGALDAAEFEQAKAHLLAE
ncbi:DUF3592 domain-containing protein [Kitasatospora sp. NPDC051170]|uniref:DUF3592 domain-containing protein n=1 Tax=Kitasatospora sp. NPDC051170 TaxID=3364056 RepID=UPI0037A57E83